jgi:phosphoglycerol transferase MdoB-like AlkP superfamily enzyme
MTIRIQAKPFVLGRLGEEFVLPKSRFSSIAVFFALYAALDTILRSLLIAKAWADLDAGPWLLAKIFFVGFFFDCVTFSYFSIPYVLLATFLSDRTFNGRIFRAGSYLLFFLATSVLLFDTAAEYLFFDEFGTRFNFIAVDYLIYTREVVKTIRESYPVARIFGGIFLAAGLFLLLVRKPLAASYRNTSTLRERVPVGVGFLLLPIASLVFVSTSWANVSRNNYANELSANGMYNFAAAFRNNELDYDRFYPTRSDEIVFERLHRLLPEKNGLAAPLHDIAREVNPAGPENRYNVILVVEESLSAEYLGVFGNTEGLTPNFDRLAGESMFFRRLYATGTRTVRGLEAITLSIPPLPGTAIVKRPDNSGMFSWGTVMKERGYDTRFLYAGYGYFDNMKSFFAGNGFTVVDRGDFSNAEVSFSNAWGVSDEDLFGKVIREAGKSHAAGKPFFHIVMTTSNHRPFTYPQGKIDIPSGTGREGGVKYADYAVGWFLDQARKEPWFGDTVFVFVADHCAGSAGKVALPVERYHIPMFIYSPAHLKPRRIDTMASQIDIAPTILGLLNVGYRTNFLGKDILQTAPAGERAFLSTYLKLAFLRGNTLTVLSPRRGIESYTVTGRDDLLSPSRPVEEDVTDAIAYYQGAGYLYRHRRDPALH